MKVNIGKAIRLILEEKHRATLPGIGTFRVLLSAASYSADKTKINPPTAKLVFSEKAVNDQSLSDFIGQLYDLSRTETLKYLNAFNEKLRAGLDKSGSVKVQDLGRFLRNDKGNLEFIANKGIEKSFFYGLEPIQNRLFSDQEKQSVPAMAQKEKLHFGKEIAYDQKTKVSDMTDNYNSDYEYGDERSKWSYLLRPLLLIAALILLSILMVKMCNKGSDEGSTKPESELSATDSDSEDTDLEYNDTESTDTEQSSSNEEEVDFDDEYADEQGKALDDTQTDQNELDNTEDSVSGAIEDSSVAIEDESGDASENTVEQIDVNKVIAPDAHIKPILIEDLEKQPVNCIIVTGSFRELSNAVRMQKKLEAAGYDSYAERINGLTRVGFFFVCEKEDLKAFIDKVRADLAKDAWYLWPRLHVE